MLLSGIEPETYALEKRCSIRLSYRSKFSYSGRNRASDNINDNKLSLSIATVSGSESSSRGYRKDACSSTTNHFRPASTAILYLFELIAEVHHTSPSTACSFNKPISRSRSLPWSLTCLMVCCTTSSAILLSPHQYEVPD